MGCGNIWDIGVKGVVCVGGGEAQKEINCYLSLEMF